MPGNVTITIVDGGTGQVVVPSTQVQVIIGPASAGTNASPVATRSLSTLSSTFGVGPMPEAAGIAIQAGATVIVMRTTQTAAGSQNAVQFTGTGTSVITTTGTALDDYMIMFKVVTGGTIGTGPIYYQVSLDAGRNFGPVLSLGTATTLLLTGTGVTLNFAAGTLVTGDVAKIGCLAPTSNDANYQACLTVLSGSQYAGVGWGSMHLVTGLAGLAGSDATTIQGYLDTMKTTYGLFTRAILSARDAIYPTTWGGAGETEATWMTSLGTSYSAVSANRICACAGAYNMPSAFPSPLYGAPRYRRPLAWALAARQVGLAPQRHAGRVKDGSLAQIVIDPINDPADGFVYHDESINPGLDYVDSGVGVNRFCAAKTRRPNLPGYFITNPLLCSQLGSDFWMLPLGNVMDLACAIVLQIGQLQVNDDLRTFPVVNGVGGNLYPNDVLSLQNDFMYGPGSNSASNSAAANNGSGGGLSALIGANNISAASTQVDGTNNVQSQKQINVAISITSRGYILKENISIGFNNNAAAQAQA